MQSNEVVGQGQRAIPTVTPVRGFEPLLHHERSPAAVQALMSHHLAIRDADRSDLQQ
jgi:hypothetical protein